MKARVLPVLLLVPMSFVIASHAWAEEAVSVADPVYEKIYPHYAEYCGLSQITKVATVGIKEVGGEGGHGVLFIRGACHDRSFGYPRIKVCDASDPLPHEVGTSINSDFMSVNWVAVDNKDFFFTGGIKPGQTFDLAAYNEVQLKAQAMDIMNGVQIHPELLEKNKIPGINDVIYEYQDSIGTDYGIGLGRSMTCARVPVNNQQLGEIVDYYNSRNEYYHDNHIPYVWNAFNDACTHTPYNALAGAGFWAPLQLDQPLLPRGIFNIAIPQNEFVDLMRRSNDLPLEEPDELFRDEYARNGLMERGWLPTQPGGLAEFTPVHTPNEVFATDVTDLLFQIPVIDPSRSDRARFVKEPRYTDVKTNLEYFLKRYQAIKKGRKPITFYTEPQGRQAARVLDPSFPDFFSKYYQYIDQQILDVTEKLSRL